MARTDDSERVFDVSRPHRVMPGPTSKPVITGHHPRTIDPMVHSKSPTPADQPAKTFSEKKITPVTVSWDEPEAPAAERPKNEGGTDLNALTADAAVEEISKAEEEKTEDIYPGATSGIGHEETAQAPHKDWDNISVPDDGGAEIPPSPEALPIVDPPGASRRGGLKGFLKWAAILLFLAGFGGYLAVDAGIVGDNVKLPFEIFKEKEPVPEVTQTTTAPKSKRDIPKVPAGFTSYKLAQTPVTFAYPTAWGTPSVTEEPGYKTRTNSSTPDLEVAKSDGTYAYLITFAAKNDVQLALTSSKLLPGKRVVRYYDFLQWCTGTVDSKFYKQQLKFTTASGTETPTTIACDQGPLADAVKIDAQTIVQPKTKDSDNKTVLGDVYTKNLAGEELTVFRVKDTTSANAESIKTLLESVKTAPSDTAQ